jgi:tetratricopeptide (TPR) repeat protein/type II secretory pathway predicted ATPase ExeA
VLYERWEAVQRGDPGHALILGDSGVGKTTLVEKLTTAAGLEGAAISRVQCYDLEREIPYSTVSSLILGLLDRPGVSATSPESLAELARTVPEVRHCFPTIPPSPDSQGETARIRLTEAFHELLSAIAEEHPVILVVDDLHYADDVSLAVLHLVMRRALGQPIMALLVARPGELPQSPQAERLRAAAATLSIRDMDLQPLSREESLELLESLIPSDQPRPTLTIQRALLKGGAGYPMVLELLIKDWQVGGEKSLVLSVDAMTADLGNSAPAVYQEILARITRSLDPITHNVLNLASLLGHRLNDPSMFGLVDLSVGQTVSGMAELVRRRVLRDGPRGLEFVNEMVRAAAYVGVPMTLRRVLHSKIADRLVKEHERGAEDLGLEIAWHCMRSGRAEEATPHLLNGARKAIRSGSPYAAERGLSTALPNLRDPDKSEGLVLLAEALQEQSRWEESLTSLDQIGSPGVSQSTNLAGVLRIRARRRLGFLEAQELSELPRKLLTFIESCTDKPSKIRAALEAASVLDTSGPELAPELLKSLLSLESDGLDLDEIAHLLLARSMLFYSMARLDSSLDCIREAYSILESRGTPSSALAMLHNGEGAILTKRGAYRDSISPYLRCNKTASQVGNDSINLQASSNLALSFFRLGEYQKAIEWATKAFACERGSSIHFYLPAAQSSVLAHAMLGKSDQAEELIQQRTKEVTLLGSPARSQAWALHSADGFAMLGKLDRAEDEGRRATSGTNSQVHMERYAGPYARWVARTTLNRGESGLGHELLDSLIRNLDRYDAIDRAEILNAKTWLGAKTGVASSHQVARMCSYLEALPSAVSDQLARMGMLDFCGR